MITYFVMYVSILHSYKHDSCNDNCKSVWANGLLSRNSHAALVVLLVFHMIGPQTVFAYFKIGRMMALNVETIGSFCLPNLLKESSHKILKVYFVLVM